MNPVSLNRKIYIWMFLGATLLGAVWPQGKIFVPWMLGFLMFALFLACLTLDIDKFKNYIRRPWTILYLSAVSLIAVPITLFVLVRPFVSTDLALALLVVASLPAGIGVMALAGYAKGDEALALALVIVASLACPFSIPILIGLLAGVSVKIGLVSMMIWLAKVIFIPLAIALVLRQLMIVQRGVVKTKDWYPLVTTVLYTLVIIGGMSKTQGGLEVFWQNLGPIALLFALNAAFHAIGWVLVPGASRELKVTSAMSFSYLNIILGIVFASKYFPQEVVLYVTLYLWPINAVFLLFSWLVNAKAKFKA